MASTMARPPLSSMCCIVVPQMHAPSMVPASQAALISSGDMNTRFTSVRSMPAFAMTASAT